MGDGDHGAFVFLQMKLQPTHRLGVQVVGRLIEQKKIRLLQQQAAQRDPPALAPGQFGDIGITRRAAERIHGNFHGALDFPAVDRVDLLLQLSLLGEQGIHLVILQGLGEFFGYLVEPGDQPGGLAKSFDHVLLDGLVRIQPRLLGQVSDRRAVGRPGFTVKFLVDSGHDLEQGRFAGSIDAEHPDFCAGKKRQRDIFDQFPPPGQDLGQLFHHIDVLVGGHGNSAVRFVVDRALLAPPPA